MVSGFGRNLPNGSSASWLLLSDCAALEQFATDVEVDQVLVHRRDFSKVSATSNKCYMRNKNRKQSWNSAGKERAHIKDAETKKQQN